MIGQEIGSYKITELIGKGGMAVVYLGQHTTLSRRTVAIKVLSAALEGDASFSERFFREAEVMDRLRHPNIVTLYDYLEKDGKYFIVMEYVSGTTLDKVIKESGGALPLSQISDIFGQVLSAIGYAHKLGIVHRDLKPSNIMINSEGQVKITDFGIARILGDNFETTLTTTGMGIGSPYYMSPEQVLVSKDNPITGASDIYSLGITLYQMATGKVPFSEGGSLFTIMQAHVKSIPPPPSEFSPDMPPALERVILKAIEKAPQERWQTCEEFWQALKPALEGKAVDVPVPHGTRPPVATETMPSATTHEMPEKRSSGLFKFVLLLVIGVAVLAGGIYYYFNKKPEIQKIAKPGSIAETTPKVKRSSGKIEQKQAPSAPQEKSEQQIKEQKISAALAEAKRLLESKNFQGAADRAREVLSMDSQNREAQAIYESAQSSINNLQVAKALEKGNGYLKSGKYTLALNQADKALKILPDNPEALKLRKRAQDLIYKRKQEQQVKKNMEVKLAKADAYLESKNYAKALALSQEVLKLDPNNNHALDIFKKAKEGQKRTSIQYKLASAKAALKKGNYAEAIVNADAVLKVSPDNQQAARIKKQAMAMRRRREKRRKINAMLKQAMAFLESGHFTRARILADRVLDIEPDNTAAQDILEMAMEGEKNHVIRNFLPGFQPGQRPPPLSPPESPDQ